jgi:glutamine amidotransferase
MKIGIIDYGSGNIGSVFNMIKKVGGDPYVINTPYMFRDASKVVMPGVGHFGNSIKLLHQTGMFDAISEYVEISQRPLLGICLGAQLLTRQSEEGSSKGFGFFNATVEHLSKLSEEGNLRVPHIGWSKINISSQNRLFDNLTLESKFYFVHSFYIKSNIPEEVMCTANYFNSFVAGLYKNNIWAVQFHPEKSHKFGFALFKNFLSNKI